MAGIPAAAFSAAAHDYASTMAPNLRPVAAEVARRAALRAGEAVLDIGTGTGIGAAAARGERRRVVGVDLAAGMLAIARSALPDVEFVESNFNALPFPDGSFDVALAVHCLLFADDPIAALAEWRRVVRPGGRLSLSVPGPVELTPMRVFGDIYRTFGLDLPVRYPTLDQLVAWIAAAGWQVSVADADPSAEIILADEAEFDSWRRVGSRGAATADWPPDRRDRLRRAMLAAAPRDAGGRFHIPFGALYVTSVRPA